jgi:quinol monooxygenase YgiN
VSVPYTSGEWIAKPGSEEAFIAAWHAMAEWGDATIDGAAGAVLTRDRAEPRRFVSFGPWRDDAAIEAFRAHPEFRERVEQIMPLLERFTPYTLDLVAEVVRPD